jgi:hypothetical protein
MNSTVQFNSNGAFETSIKENPRLNYHKFRLELISYASSQCNEITGPTCLLAWTFSASQWAAIPGDSVVNAIFDNIIAAEEPVGNAANVRRGDLNNTIKRALQALGIKPATAGHLFVSPGSPFYTPGSLS